MVSSPVSHVFKTFNHKSGILSGRPISTRSRRQEENATVLPATRVDFSSTINSERDYSILVKIILEPTNLSIREIGKLHLNLETR